jgi:hypothetical protein
MKILSYRTWNTLHLEEDASYIDGWNMAPYRLVYKYVVELHIFYATFAVHTHQLILRIALVWAMTQKVI